MTNQIDLTKVCRSFPFSETEPMVDRAHMLDTIDSMFDSGVKCVLLEGEAGIGKTTLAAQYALRHSSNSISLFIRTSNRWGYDFELLREDIASQLHLMMWGANVSFDQQVDDSVYSQLLYRLRKHQRSSGTPCYFIVDGLDEMPKSAAGECLKILDLLPLDFNRCFFLFTAADASLLQPAGRLARKEYPLAGFSKDESRRFFEECETNVDQIAEIHRICRGIPGYLSSIRRCLTKGQSPDELLAQIKGSLAAIIENEWRQMESASEKHRLLLAVLALDDSVNTVSDLARLIDEPVEGAIAMLRNTTFLDFDECAMEVAYASTTVRQFAADKLRSLQGQVDNLLIDDLLREPTSDRTLQLLPRRYARTGRYKDLLKYLSPEHVLEVVEHGQSMAVLRRQVEYGVEAARQLNERADFIRFCMQQSALCENYSLDVCRAEINARLALGDGARAIVIANSARLKEDRLRLLAAVARGKRTHGHTVEQDLIEAIRSAYDQLDPDQLATVASDLANDLIFAAPELAIQLLDKMRASATPSVSRHADAPGGLAIEMPQQAGSEQLMMLRAQVNDPRLQAFFSAAALFLGGLSSQEAVDEIESIGRPQDKIFFLRRWCLRNRLRPDAGRVIELGLRLTIQTTGYTPNASDIRQLITPLPNLKDRVLVEGIIRTMDAQQGSFRKYGPTVDYVRVQLLIAEAETRWHENGGQQRVLDVYEYVMQELPDLSIRVECLSHMLALLARLNPSHALVNKEQMHLVLEKDFDESIKDLLARTADHLAICRGTISALAPFRFDLAANVAKSLNMLDRRDRAMLLAVKAALASPDGQTQITPIIQLLDRIVDPRVRSDAIMTALELLGDEDLKQSPTSIPDVMRFADRISAVRYPLQQCRAYVLAHNLLCRADKSGSAVTRVAIIEKLRGAWERIDALWDRVAAGFGIAADLASSSPEASLSYLADADAAKTEILTHSPGATDSYMAALELAVSSFAGLMRTRSDTTEDLDRIATLVSQVPSSRVQAELWADMAERFFTASRLDEAKEIFTSRLRPLLNGLQTTDPGSFREALLAVTPILARVSPNSIQAELRCLSDAERDDALSRACRFIIWNQPLSQPSDYVAHHAFAVQYEDVNAIIALLNLATSDAGLYSIIEELADSLDDREMRQKLTAQQYQDIAKSLQDIVDTKLPCRDGIEHKGYVIAANAQIARIRKDGKNVWDKLIQQAQAIPNVADRGYVLSILADLMIRRDSGQSRLLFEQAKTLVAQIPATEDRIGHTHTLAKLYWDLDAVQAKQLCRETVSCPAGDSPNLSRYQREIVDFAYRRDPDFATSLIATLDDDPARIAERDRLRARKEILETKKAMLDGVDDSKPKSVQNCVEAAKLSLAALNSGRSQASDPQRLDQYLQVSAQISLAEAHPILAWAVANTSRKYGVTRESAIQHIRPVFEATLLACRVSARMTARASGLRSAVVLDPRHEASASGSLFVGPNEREKGLDFIRRWLEESAVEYLKICDYYFGPGDLDVLKLVLSHKPDLVVSIVTSQTSLKDAGGGMLDSEYFERIWRVKFSDQAPPPTEILGVSVAPKGDLPIHDRWWISKGAGIAIGTSINSLGISKECRIDRLTEDELSEAESRVDRFSVSRVRDYQGQRARYSLYSL